MENDIDVVCALAHPDDRHFILNQAKKLGCGHFVCTKCFSREREYICCNQCYKESKVEDVEGTIFDQIDENFNKIYDEMGKQFETVHSILKERKDEFMGTINYLKDEIDIRVESLKQELEDQADKLKCKLDDLLTQLDPDNSKYTYRHEVMERGDDGCESKSLVNEEMLIKIQETISSMRKALQDYRSQTAVHISERKLKENMFIEQDFDFYKIFSLYKNPKVVSRDVVPNSIQIMDFCLLSNGNTCIIGPKNSLYEVDVYGGIKEVKITDINGIKELLRVGNMRYCAVRTVFGDSDGFIYISMFINHTSIKLILKLNNEYQLICGRFIDNLNATKMHVYNNHLYLANLIYCKSIGEIYKLSRDDLNEVYKHDIAPCSKDLAFFNNSLAIFYHSYVYFYDLEPFNIKYCYELNEICCYAYLTVLNNRICVYRRIRGDIQVWSFDETQKFIDFREYNDYLECDTKEIREFKGYYYLVYFYDEDGTALVKVKV